MTKIFALAAAVLVMFVRPLSGVAEPAETAWKVFAEHRDFPVENADEVISRACEELKGVYGSDFDADAIVKNKHYIHSVRSETYKTDLLVVMFEDRSVDEPNCYYEVVFELPAMDQIGIGGVWLDESIEQHLVTILDEIFVYGEEYD
jgi:hypothetical protein